MPTRSLQKAVPQFVKIADNLENLITDGYYQPGDALPTFKDLSKKYNVSLMTINHSIRELSTRGRIVRKRGKGVFVTGTEEGRKKTYLVGLVVPDLANPYFSQLAKEVQQKLFEHDYALITQSTSGDLVAMNRCIRQLYNRDVEGILAVPLEIDQPEQEEMLWKLKLERIPFVYINDRFSRVPSDYAIVDVALGMQMIAKHLLEYGHTRIGCVSAEPYIEITDLKIRTLIKTLREAGANNPEQYVIISDKQHEDGGFEAALELLQHPDQPSAVVATNDLIATGVMRAAKSLGLSIPGDLSVTGFDDIDAARLSDPPLTTVRQPVEVIADKAVSILIDRIEGRLDPDFRTYTLAPKLVIRSSTAHLIDQIH